MSSDNSKSPKEMMEEAKKSLEKTSAQMQDFGTSLKSIIKSGVAASNRALANMEESTEKIRTPVVSAMKTIESEGKTVAHQVGHVYQVRHEYAPHIIGGASLLGGLIGLRRGRVPAVMVGSLSGFFAYLGVYQVDISKLPDHVFGKK